MSELKQIEAALLQTARRRRLERGLRSMWLGLLIGAAIWVLAIAIYKVAPISGSFPPFSWVLLPIGAAIGFLTGWARRITLNETARWVDGRKNLQERVSTALEMANSDKAGEWKNLLVADAARIMHGFQPREILPFKLPRTSRWALLLIILGAGLGFVPEYRSKNFVKKRQEAAAIKETGRELAQLTKQSLETRPPAIETTKKALEEVQELGEYMAKAQLTRSEALKDLSSITEKLRDQAKELADNPALRNLERAARNASRSGSPSSALQQKLDAMASKMAANAANSDAMDKFKSDLEKAKNAAAKLPKEGEPGAEEARDKLNASISDLAKQARDMGLDLPSLSEAIAALQNAEPDQVLRDLQVAEIELEKMEQMAKALEKMQLDGQKLGKDLAEQLRQGQAEAAESTLRKMAEELEKGNISEEQMKKIMEEVASALDPAQQYGEVEAEMKKAMASMKSGDKSSAGESLSKAADELSKMMGELGDAESLLAALESLQQASMSIANGMGYNPQGRPAAGRRSGAETSSGGVGTWHDENSWVYPEFTDKWDNTGVVRPDTDGRGVSDRGDGQLADNLAPTKIKGQITPGGPMPSITMKGVSIKGNSKVEYQEMTAAAQSEAQSALNQDQVPRAYQNAVRNYFDDLQE